MLRRPHLHLLTAPHCDGAEAVRAGPPDDLAPPPQFLAGKARLGHSNRQLPPLCSAAAGWNAQPPSRFSAPSSQRRGRWSELAGSPAERRVRIANAVRLTSPPKEPS